MAGEEADPFGETPESVTEQKKPSMVGCLVFVVLAALGVGFCATQNSDDQTPL